MICSVFQPRSFRRRSGETGRRAGLKIPWGLRPVRVRFPPPAPPNSSQMNKFSHFSAAALTGAQRQDSGGARVGGDPDQLGQVILKETAIEPTADGFRHTVVTTNCELVLVDGIYQVRVWTASDPAIVQSTITDGVDCGRVGHADRRGTPLDFILFTSCTTTGTTADVAKPPLEDLAELMLSHCLLA